MAAMIARRIVWMIPTLLVISFLSFAIIQLPPGDYLSSYIAALEESGETVSEERAEALRAQFNLDQPFIVQYLDWLGGVLTGDLGQSFEWNRPVTELLGERLALTMAISVLTILFTWLLAIPIGVYSAVRKYSVLDHTITLIGYIGLATPNFLLALIFMYIGFSWFGTDPSGLFSAEYENAPWSWGKLGDFLLHAWIPVVVIGTSGTAGLIRIMRGNLLDELGKLYVVAARAKGLGFWRLVVKYPVRVAINPLISTIGWLLPQVVSGAVITAVVLNLPTIGPLLLRSLMNQDMYLAGSIVMILATLTVVGTLISDILLMILDPRIRMDQARG